MPSLAAVAAPATAKPITIGVDYKNILEKGCEINDNRIMPYHL
jgi:hypothetical protein